MALTVARKALLASAIVLGIVIIAAGTFYWQQLRGVGPAVRPPVADITEALTAANLDLPGGKQPLQLPEGFSIEVFAKNVPGARAMVRDSFGNFWVSQPNEGKVTQLEIDKKTGAVKAQHAVFQGLDRPHGLALDPDFSTMLYIAEEHRIVRVPLYSDGSIEPVLDLPSGAGHSTRTLGFGPDKRLYVSIGSSCNACAEKDQRRAAILSLKPDGTDVQTVATGLRNAVFFAWHPKTQELWATENSRDLLGDDVPPDEINIVEAGQEYGWPYCYGKNIVDVAFDDSAEARGHCAESVLPHVEIPAHSAPLGIEFAPESWPKEYAGDAFVAYHGSWNRSEPTGYKLVRVKLDEEGVFEGIEDFITGWLTDTEETLGRPVGIFFLDDELFVTDDKAGVIYRITPEAL